MILCRFKQKQAQLQQCFLFKSAMDTRIKKGIPFEGCLFVGQTWRKNGGSTHSFSKTTDKKTVPSFGEGTVFI